MSEPLPAVELDTERLLLRPYIAQDAPDVKLACNDPATRRWIPLPDPYDDEVARGWVEDLSHRTRRAGTGTTFAAVARDTGRLVASFGLHEVSQRNKSAEMGYWVAPWARGRGYGAEAARRLAGHAFDDLGLGRVEVLVDPANGASHGVAVRMGCSYEGLRPAAGVHGDRRVDLAVWRLLAGDPFPAARLLPDAAERSDGVVTVRPAHPADAAELLAEVSDAEYLRWLPVTDPPRPSPTLERVVRRLEETRWRWLSGQSAAFTVLDTASGRYAGTVKLHLLGLDRGVASVGYGGHPAFRGRGLIRRGLSLVSRWGFAEAGLTRLEAGVAIGNTGSAHLAESAGFHREGVRRQAQLLPGGRTDMALFGLLPGDLP